MIGESLELIEVVSWNPDNIDYGELIHVHDGTEGGVTTFKDRGIEYLQEFLADVRIRDGGLRQFLLDEQCDHDVIEGIMANEKRPDTRRPSAKVYAEPPWDGNRATSALRRDAACAAGRWI
jgi:hypothetical protein